MPAVTQEELDALRKENDGLRDKLASARAKQAENEAARAREHEALLLAAENTRLQAEVARAEEASKVTASRQGVANQIEAAQAALEIAAAQAEQVSPTVNVNDPDNVKQGEKLVADAEKAAAKDGGLTDAGSVPVAEVSVPADAAPVKNGGNS